LNAAQLVSAVSVGGDRFFAVAADDLQSRRPQPERCGRFVINSTLLCAAGMS